ncbi:MAG: Fe-S cluster assembly protein SufD [Bacteroidota bacterium]|nr:Fe-S cluster assembly protein SufD [Bacteroidota bacterium]
MNKPNDIKQRFLKNLSLTSDSIFSENKRKSFIKKINDLSFPDIKNEDWRFTDLTPLLSLDFNIIKNKVTSEDIQIEKKIIKNLDSIVLVFINGILYEDLSNITDNKLFIGNISKGKLLQNEIINKYLNCLPEPNNIFALINAAYSVDGAFIYLPENYISDKPIQLIYINDSEISNSLSQTRNIIIAEKNSQLKIIESYISLSNKNNSFTNSFTTVFAQENSNIEYYKLQNENEHSFQINNTEIIQAKESSVNLNTISLNGGLIRNNSNVLLNGENTEIFLNGLYIIDSNKHIDNHTYIDHAKSNCSSNELYKGILKDTSTGVFDGKIMVRKDSQKTNAFQANKNILLSDAAKINTQPHLEIYADDVKCSHGATVGQLDQEAMFYLRSRGIDKDKAKSLLMYAFISDIINSVKIDELKQSIKHQVFNKLKMDSIL